MALRGEMIDFFFFFFFSFLRPSFTDRSRGDRSRQVEYQAAINNATIGWSRAKQLFRQLRGHPRAYNNILDAFRAAMFPLLHYLLACGVSNIFTRIKASVYRLKVNLTRIHGKPYREIGVKLL